MDGRRVGWTAAAVSLLTTEQWLGAQFWGRSHLQIPFLTSLCYLAQRMTHLKTLKIVVEWTNEWENKPNQSKKDLVGSVSGASLKSFLSCSLPVQHPHSAYHTFCHLSHWGASHSSRPFVWDKLLKYAIQDLPKSSSLYCSALSNILHFTHK